MRAIHPRGHGVGNAVRRNGNAERRDHWHRRDSDLDLGAALISSGVLLQAGVLVYRFVAITFLMDVRKRHGWRQRSPDAGLCNADRLGEKHPCHKKAADCATNSGTAKYHESLTLIEDHTPL